MNKKIYKIQLIIYVLVFISSYSQFSIRILDYNNTIAPDETKNLENFQLKTSAVWILTGTPIFIDDNDPNYNWSKTAAENDWCTGTGTFGDPYYLQNILIDGQYGGFSNLIDIRDSSVHFVIRNCELYNAGYTDGKSGIFLNRVENGNILNNYISECTYGIYLNTFTHNIRVASNFISSNYRDGIRFDDHSYSNILYNNTIALNNQRGIHFSDHIHDNEIKENTLYNNTIAAIHLYHDSNSNNITDNTIYNNELRGINLHASDYNDVSGNVIYHSGKGIELAGGSDWNILHDNLIYDCTEYDYYWVPSQVNGIQIETGSGNVINNNQIHNSRNGIYLENTHDINVTGNTIWDNEMDNVQLVDTNHIKLSDNVMTGSGLFIDISSPYLPNVDIDTSNTVNGNPIYCKYNQTNLNSGDFTNAGQIYLYYCDYATLSNLEFSNVTTGITLNYCNNVSISSIDTSYNSRWGLGLYQCFDNLISQVNAFSSKSGIEMEQCDDNLIVNNLISDISDKGIGLINCSTNIIYGNFLNSCGSGLYISGTNNSYIYNNTAIFNDVGFKIINYGEGVHKWIFWSVINNLTFISNIANGNVEGIIIDSVINSIIAHNTVSNCGRGISVTDTKDCLIYENEANNNDFHGIRLRDGLETEFYNNTAKENYLYRIGFQTVGDGFAIQNCESIDVYNNYGFRNRNGLVVSYSRDCVIRENILNENGVIQKGITEEGPIYNNYGLILDESEFIEVFNNSFYYNYIRLESSNENSLILNDIVWGGFSLEGCHQNIIMENTIYRGARGVALRDCSYNQIIDNSITSLQCFRESGNCIGNIFENNICDESLPYFPLREIMAIIGFAAVLGVNIPLSLYYLKKRKNR
jgi:parallel beta-helix repeat protein